MSSRREFLAGSLAASAAAAPALAASNTISLRTHEWFGDKLEQFPLPPGWNVRFYHTQGAKNPVLTPAEIKKAIQKPDRDPAFARNRRGQDHRGHRRRRPHAADSHPRDRAARDRGTERRGHQGREHPVRGGPRRPLPDEWNGNGEEDRRAGRVSPSLGQPQHLGEPGGPGKDEGGQPDSAQHLLLQRRRQDHAQRAEAARHSGLCRRAQTDPAGHLEHQDHPLHAQRGEAGAAAGQGRARTPDLPRVRERAARRT